ncbi:DUF2914 domain-containing protein [Chlorobium sp. N1]|uniref:DUF2914 domain-containing protein n=1 Tax=Chlorobium sp. N1 TaxID=2491138 RepID=UPI00103ED648|nr:DUF2914 domain-containing protein [Chlorobium sp. N1]TCD47042.1 DUF2914 domain-containing protein [Chlorobium sp. N1]
MENMTEFVRIGRTILDTLRKAREGKGLSLEEAARMAGTAPDRLARLEAGDLEILPPAYTVALMREYAQALGAYDEPLFHELKEAAGIPVPRSSTTRPVPDHREQQPGLWRNAFAGAVAVTLLIAAWLLVGRACQTPSRTVQKTPDPAMTAAAPPAPVPAPSAAPLPEPDTLQSQAPAINADSAPASGATVAHSCFTTSIDREKRSPLDRLRRTPQQETAIAYFSDILNPSGKPLYHEWLFNGKTVQRIAVGTPTGRRWRCWSQKTVGRGEEGTWTVRIVEGEGTVLHTDSIPAGTLPAAAE